MLQFVDLRFADPAIFCGLLQILNYIIFIHTNKASNAFTQIWIRLLVFWTVLSNKAFRSLNYFLCTLGKENIRGKPMRIWIRNTVFCLANLQIAICGLGHQGNSRICGLWTGTHKKLMDLRLRNEPKNYRICDMRTDTKICLLWSACIWGRKWSDRNSTTTFLFLYLFVYILRKNCKCFVLTCVSVTRSNNKSVCTWTSSLNFSLDFMGKAQSFLMLHWVNLKHSSSYLAKIFNSKI